MTFTSFLMILLAVYIFYYLIVILLDVKPDGKKLAIQNSQVDFVCTPVQNPAKITLDETLQKYMPKAEEEPDDIEKGDQKEVQETSLQSMMRMETWSEVEPEEFSGEELSQML